MSEKFMKRLLPILFVALVATVFLLIGLTVPALPGLQRTETFRMEYAESTTTTQTTTQATSAVRSTTTQTADTATDISSTTTTSVDTLNTICLNTATKEELMSVNGIGEVFAQRILDYRNEIGAFQSVEELKNIIGIGEKRYAQWSPYFTIS